MDREASNRSSVEETQDAIAPEKEAKQKRKSLGLDDPYEHAPPKPDGDLWAILLKPELEADKVRCDAWKEEVQNLLIFAGLFSAVVTAFVIESYKFLQPDPNDTIISLLSQIANGPNITSSPTRSSTSMVASFVQKPSSVRINVFWFISLILSLTTVLMGTIALQWLREHQSYPGLSPKETLAILHMRSESLKAWYVPQVFSTLPLLLQGALVLFLAGLIDFTLPLGTKLTAPITCIIGLILLFLAATTALPAIQCLFLLSGLLSRDTVPTPCAFKSPQSQLFRTLSGLFLQFLSFILPTAYLPETRVWKGMDNILPHDSDRRHLFPHIYTVWHRQTWPTFDFEWLSLRDAWHNGILDKDVDLYEHRTEWGDTFPLSDIMQCLVNAEKESTSAKHTEEFLVAACYCFQEISASIWNIEFTMAFGNYRRVDRRSNYFEQIYRQQNLSATTTWMCSASKFLIHGGTYEYGRFTDYFLVSVSLYVLEHQNLFHQDQTLRFLHILLQHHTSPLLECYQLEIQSRTMQYLMKHRIIPLTPMPNINDFDFLSLPEFSISFAQRQDTYLTASDSVNLLTNIFENVAFYPTHLHDEFDSLYTHRSVLRILDMLAAGIISHVQSMAKIDPEASESNQEYLYVHDINDEYISTFRSMAKHLNNEISNSETTSPSLFFCLSAILLDRLFRGMKQTATDAISEGKVIHFSEALAVLLDTCVLYKEQIMTGQGNAAVRAPLKDSDYTKVVGTGFDNAGMPMVDSHDIERFSDEWWTDFFLAYDRSGLRGIKKSPVASSSMPFNTTPPLLASAPNEPHLPVSPSTSSSSLRIYSESTTNLVIASSHTSNSDAATIPNMMSGAHPLGQVDEHPAGANAQWTSLSSPVATESLEHTDADVQPPSISSTFFEVGVESPSESPAQGMQPQALSSGLLVRDHDSPHDAPTSSDSVIDMQRLG